MRKYWDIKYKMENNTTARISLLLGVVWLIMGFSYDKIVSMILGGILLCLGLIIKFKKEKTEKLQDNNTEK